MQTVRSVKNQYLGINAHLHSYLQARSDWTGFHNVHLTFLLSTLRRKLQPLGYQVLIKKSLQIQGQKISPYTPQTDITIWGSQPPLLTLDSSPDITVLTNTPEILTVHEAIEDFEINDYNTTAIAIYKLPWVEDAHPVGWIELLSPFNKYGGLGYINYLTKRLEMLRMLTTFIELDYLHETPPTIHRSDHYPYRIIVFDPRPKLSLGKVFHYPFWVDTPIPTINIPLAGDDMVSVDFDTLYQTAFTATYEGDSAYINYVELPLNFERYSPADQARIANRMATVLQAVQEGIDLETAPFPVETLPLEDALHKVALFKQ